MNRPFTPNFLPLEEIDWSSLVELIGDANAALARFDGRLEAMLNPNVLLSPLTTKEAVLSSKIEGTQATLEEVLEYEGDPTEHPERTEDIKEIINYRRALLYAEETLKERPLSVNLIKSTHALLLEGVRGQHRARGEFRKIQNWIGKPNCTIEEATYVPPPPNTLIDCMGNLEEYYHSDEKDKLVQLAIIHAQFELIHPFLDGNGRIGRILVPLFLADKQRLKSPTFYISDYVEDTREEYYERLQNISKNNDWHSWIVYFLNAVLQQAKYNSSQVHDIMELYAEMKVKVVETTHSQFAIQALDYIFSRPIFNGSTFIQGSEIPRPTAARVLKCLVEADILKVLRPGRGRKPALYAFNKLLDLIN